MNACAPDGKYLDLEIEMEVFIKKQVNFDLLIHFKLINVQDISVQSSFDSIQTIYVYRIICILYYPKLALLYH